MRRLLFLVVLLASSSAAQVTATDPVASQPQEVALGGSPDLASSGNGTGALPQTSQGPANGTDASTPEPAPAPLVTSASVPVLPLDLFGLLGGARPISFHTSPPATAGLPGLLPTSESKSSVAPIAMPPSTPPDGTTSSPPSLAAPAAPAAAPTVMRGPEHGHEPPPTPLGTAADPARPGHHDWPLVFVAAAGLLPFALLWKFLSFLATQTPRARRGVRRMILAHIERHPGTRYTDLVRLVGLGHGTVEHHLHALLREGLLVHHRRAGCAFYATPDADVAAAACQALVRGSARHIVEEIGRNQCIRLADLARSVRMARQSVHHHVNRLVEAGILRDRRHGSSRELELTPSAARWLGALDQ